MDANDDQQQEVPLPATYPLPEALEHQRQLGDMSIFGSEPIWRVQMTKMQKRITKLGWERVWTMTKTGTC